MTEDIINSIEKENKPSQLYQWVSLYSNLVARGVLSFAIMVIVTFILRLWLHTSVIVTLIIAFILSILISPFFSRINIGSKLLDKYILWLNNVFKLEKTENL